MDSVLLARIIHVIAIVFWIGGVAMVTTVVVPLIKKQGFSVFETIENKFSFQAKFSTLLAGISGFYMVYALNLWNRFMDFNYWWMHAMVAIWTIFTLVIFILEPFFLDKLFKKFSQSHPQKTQRFLLVFHLILLSLSLITIAGALAGIHHWE